MTWVVSALTALCVLAAPGVSVAQGDPITIFAVVIKVPKDRKQVAAHVSDGNTVTETTLVAGDAVLDNLIWKKLEICHALRAEAWKTPEGYKLDSVKALDAGMLPMELQGVAGDCLLKKALEYAPLVD